MSIEYMPGVIRGSHYLINGNCWYHYINFILCVLHYGREVELAVQVVMNGLDILFKFSSIARIPLFWYYSRFLQ